MPDIAYNIMSSTCVNSVSGCAHFTITQSSRPHKSSSTYTSQGRHKATPCDPIKTIEHINMACQYFLTTGSKALRLRNYTLFVVGVSIGLRGCDLLELRMKDVLNLDGTPKDRISVYESKTGKMNYPFLNHEAQGAITNYLQSIPSYSMNDYLFPNRSGGKLDGDSLYQLMNKMGKNLNLPYHLGAHSLRKTFAYWNINLHRNDVNVLAALQEMLNHESMRTTLHYSGQTTDHHEKLYNDIGSIFHEDTVVLPNTDTLEAKLDQVIKLFTE